MHARAIRIIGLLGSSYAILRFSLFGYNSMQEIKCFALINRIDFEICTV